MDCAAVHLRYVDLFSLYRPDVRANIEPGKVFVFASPRDALAFTHAVRSCSAPNTVGPISAAATGRP